MNSTFPQEERSSSSHSCSFRTAAGNSVRAALRWEKTNVTCGLTERRDAVELCLVHQQVHVDGARVQLLGPQEVEDGSEQRGVSVDEDLHKSKGGSGGAHRGRRGAATCKPTAPVSSFRVEMRPLSRLTEKTQIFRKSLHGPQTDGPRTGPEDQPGEEGVRNPGERLSGGAEPVDKQLVSFLRVLWRASSTRPHSSSRCCWTEPLWTRRPSPPSSAVITSFWGPKDGPAGAEGPTPSVAPEKLMLGPGVE